MQPSKGLEQSISTLQQLLNIAVDQEAITLIYIIEHRAGMGVKYGVFGGSMATCGTKYRCPQLCIAVITQRPWKQAYIQFYISIIIIYICITI